jgi:hypothetical protein
VTERRAIHLHDDQLLLHASGELTGPTVASLSAHFDSCPQCKARLHELESALGELTQAHSTPLDEELPSAAGPRALLKAQLTRLMSTDLQNRDLPDRASSSPPRAVGGHFHRFGLSMPNWRSAMAFASLALVLYIANRSWHRNATASTLAVSSLSDEPNVQFTPGAVVAVTQREICSESMETSAAIPLAIKNKVLQLYGVPSNQGDAYEVDYLITPELGGATDVRNLWPEPYDHTVWNAHVKDRLEDRLHEMVCRGDIDLATAQRDISTDWIAAYRKYFHADVPVGSS